MLVTPSRIPDVKIIEPRVFEDARGFFMESFNAERFRTLLGAAKPFVQDNHSGSRRNVLRGLHYQVGRAQGKLVRAVVGEVFDVAVDLRRSSPTVGQWVGATLSARNRRQIWIPEGFAHGYLVLSEYAECEYKTTEFYRPADERCVLWSDPAIGIEWPLEGDPIVSEKDRAGVRLQDADWFR